MPVIRSGNQEFHLQHSEEEKLNQFQAVTTFPDDELPLIITLLQNHSWNLEPALSRYFDGDWKDNLSSQRIPSRDEHSSFTHISRGLGSQSSMAFMANDQSFVPSLPVVTALPQNYKEKFQLVGLQPDKSKFNSNPILLILMLLPSFLVKLGINICTFLWQVITFGYGAGLSSGSQKVSIFPTKFVGPERSVEDEITAILGDESQELLRLKTNSSYNAALKDCESKFKFLLIIILGDLTGETTDLNSQRFVKNILAERSTLEFLNEKKDELTIYLGTVYDKESWSVGKHMGVKYTPECYLVANVLNSNSSASSSSLTSTPKMSVVGDIRIQSLKRFQRSLKFHMDKYTPELVVSRTEREELELERKIKQLQDEAYEESLRQDQIKEEKRRLEQEEIKLAKILREQVKYNAKAHNTLRHLFWLKASLLNLVEKPQKNENKAATTSEKPAILQIRTSDGKRMVKTFPGSTPLRDLYVDIGCHLFLGEFSEDPTVLLKRLTDKLLAAASNNELLCFKSNSDQDLSTIESIKLLLTEEYSKWDNSGRDDQEQCESFIDFELVSSFPRYKIPLDNTLKIEGVSQIWPNGSLLVEYVDEEEEEDDSADDSTA
ncbi:HFL214Wp [Eremothecium sinecaudum]|uniref:HFL214Wp n=1 Tax=Eremothecium sinecaudum TaxID=45286 RepID=A0A0X8HUD2_9SACH|nr:HFL214Wp [Eremothecium sinecaudum]AMD21642.1 HFL214Wp [Eremothecium sinecaudum]